MEISKNEELEDKMNALAENGKEIKFTDVRASDVKRTKEATNLTRFSSEQEMIDSAEDKYATRNREMMEADKAKGFDINDMKSIEDFNIGYTPLGNSVLVKVINEEHKIGTIIIPDNSNLNLKVVICVAGLFVNSLLPGDVVTIKPIQGASNPMPPHIDRIFKGVTFKEIDYSVVAGVFKTRKEIMARIAEDNKLMNIKE